MKENIFSRKILGSDTAILIYLACAKLLIHLLTSTGYGYSGDELYYLGMMKHLDFGYVDIPPLVPLFMFISNAIVGTSLFAIHILPAIIGAVMVFFAGLLARELGGGRFAQGFTALMVLAAPSWLAVNSGFTYNPFHLLFVVIVFYLVARIIKQESPKRWLILGIIIGLGIMIKLSMIFIALALLVALVITSRRKSFIIRWPWLAMLIVIGICSPYLIWQWIHHWPLITYWHHYAQLRNSITPFIFWQKLILDTNPISLPIWIGGLYYLLFHREGKQYRVLALIYLLLLVFFMSMQFDPGMQVTSYFPLFAGGAVLLERLITKIRWNWLKPVYAGILLLGGLILAPYYLPVLPIADYLNYAKTTSGIATVVKNGWFEQDTQLPSIFATRLGWPEMVKQIADIYHSLPEADRQKCVIYTSTYEEAGAIDFFGKAYGLPDAISNHLTYHIWGPGKYSGAVAIAFGWRFTKLGGGSYQLPLSGIYNEVTPSGIINGSNYSTRFEQNLPSFICRKPNTSLKEEWKWLEYYY